MQRQRGNTIGVHAKFALKWQPLIKVNTLT